MSTALTRTDQETPILYVAFELGEREWKLAMSPGLEAPPRLRTVRSRGTGRLMEVLGEERKRLGADQVVSCYEAGRDGFWLHRFLVEAGIENRIVDSASIEVRRRARRVKTDRLDAQKLLTMLQREALGEGDVWSVVRVPSVEDEDARSLQREYRTLVKERSRSSNRIKGLLASQGLVAPRIDGGFLAWLATARLWESSRSKRSGATGSRTRATGAWTRSEPCSRSRALATALPGPGDSSSSAGGTSATERRSAPSRVLRQRPTKAATRNTSSVSVERGIAGSGASPSRSPGAGFATNRTVRSPTGTTNVSRAAVPVRARSGSLRWHGNSSLRSGATSKPAPCPREPC